MGEKNIEDRITVVENDLATIKKALLENQIIPVTGSTPAGGESSSLTAVRNLYSNVLRQFQALRPTFETLHGSLLTEIQNHLNAVRVEAALSSFDLLRERAFNFASGQSETEQSFSFRTALLSLRNAIGDFSPSVIIGDTDKLPGDMTEGVTDGNNPTGDKWPL